MVLKQQVVQLFPLYKGAVEIEDVERCFGKRVLCPLSCSLSLCLSLSLTVSVSSSLCLSITLSLSLSFLSSLFLSLSLLPSLSLSLVRAHCLVRVFTEMTESYLYDTVHPSPEGVGDMSMFDLMIECSRHPEFEVCLCPKMSVPIVKQEC